MNKSTAKFAEYLKAHASSGTVKVYIDALERWFLFLNGENTTASSAQKYVDHLIHLGKAANTVALRGHAIIRWFRWQGKTIILDLPTIRMRDPEYLSLQEVEKVLATCKTALEKTLIIVLFDTAVRIVELLGLQLNDIDWELGLISVIRKGGRREEVNISERAITALKKWIDSRMSKSKSVFMDLDYYHAWLIIRDVGKRAKIKLHPHIFRHSRAIHMLKSGRDLHDVKEHLGHVNIATTANIYGRFKAIDLKERIPTW